MLKKPSNRYALPKVILSTVDHEKILEFKVKYEKLARLDRLVVERMHFDGESVVFDEVIANSGDLEIAYQDDHRKLLIQAAGKSYTITGKKVGGKKRKLEERISRAKIQLTLTDGQEDQHRRIRATVTEKALLEPKEDRDIYSKISDRKIKTSKEIYLVKRFLSYRSDLLFYYFFVDNFFKVGNNKQELWKIKFQNQPELIEYFRFIINDRFKNAKNDKFDNYLKNDKAIQEDLEKIQKVFEKLRHALMHYDYGFFEKLFGGEDQGFDLDIAFLDNFVKKIDKLNIDTKKEFVDDEKIKIFGEDLNLADLYKLYASISINRVGFNRVVNEMIIKDGIEKSELKRAFEKKLDKTYALDIHSDPSYKKLYNEHKRLVTEVSTYTDGNKIKEGNQKIAKLKYEMKEITKKNALVRLECKMRLAFGLIYGRYDTHEAFKNGFDTDLKRGEFAQIGSEEAIGYFNTTFEKSKPKSKEEIKKIARQIDNLSLSTLIEDDPLMKFIVLMFLFVPRELKGEFLGFWRKYYHDIHSIDSDAKSDEMPDEVSLSLKLKILTRNIRRLNLFEYSLSEKIKYSPKNTQFYTDKSPYQKVYKRLKISHNKEEFDKTLLVPLFRYYSILFKLINDFEIYSLAKANPDASSLSELTKTKHGFRGHYNFTTLMMDAHKVSQGDSKKHFGIRGEIAHINTKDLIYDPLFRKSKMAQQRNDVIDFVLKYEKEIKAVLGYDAINDFRMKVVQLRTKLKVYSDKTQTIEKLLNEVEAPDDFYVLYKVKGVEAINKYLLEIVSVTQAEEEIERKIITGNKRYNT